MKKHLAAFLLALSLTASAETVTINVPEIYMPTDGNAYVALTVQPCHLEEYKETYPFRAYAEEEDGTKHEGCYKQWEEVFNTVWMDSPNLIYTFHQSLFLPVKPDVKGVLEEKEIKGEF